MAIEYRFRFSEEFLLTSLARYRKQLGWYGWYRSLKAVAGLLMAVLAAGAFYADALTIGAGAVQRHPCVHRPHGNQGPHTHHLIPKGDKA
jgi:hypothetical protein